jgi:hypothetical protein
MRKRAARYSRRWLGGEQTKRDCGARVVRVKR